MWRSLRNMFTKGLAIGGRGLLVVFGLRAYSIQTLIEYFIGEPPLKSCCVYAVESVNLPVDGAESAPDADDCAGAPHSKIEHEWGLVAYWLCRGLGLLIAAQVWWSSAFTSPADPLFGRTAESYT